MSRLLAPKQYRDKVCESCGETYTPTSGRQRWCSPACRDGETVEAPAVATVSEPQEGARPLATANLLEAVREAVERNVAELEWTGEDRDGSEYRSSAFPFVRWLRGHPELENLDPPGFADAVEPVLDDLLTTGAIDVQPVEVLPRTAWTCALGETDCYGNPQDPLEDALKLWASLRPVPGLAGAVRDARRWEERGHPDRFGEAWSSPRYKPRRIFIGTCQALSVWSREAGTPEGTFPLAIKPLARELGWPWTTVRDWRTWAEDYGFLDRVGDYAKGKAATYRLGPAFGEGPTW